MLDECAWHFFLSFKKNAVGLGSLAASHWPCTFYCATSYLALLSQESASVLYLQKGFQESLHLPFQAWSFTSKHHPLSSTSLAAPKHYWGIVQRFFCMHVPQFSVEDHLCNTQQVSLPLGSSFSTNTKCKSLQYKPNSWVLLLIRWRWCFLLWSSN